MTAMLMILTKVVSIFGLILVGFGAYRLNILGDSSVPVITSLLMNITCPCLLINSMYTKEFSDDLLGTSVVVMVLTAVFYAMASVATYGFLKLFNVKPREQWGGYIPAVAATNSGFMGFPITKALFGNDMLYLMIMGNIILNVYLLGIVPSVLGDGVDQKFSLKKFAKNFFNPIMIAIIIGGVMMAFQVKPPQVLDEIFTMLSDVTIPISMVLVGLHLGPTKLISILKRDVMLVSLFSMIVLPLITFLIMHPISGISVDMKIIMILTAAFPTAVLCVVVADQTGRDAGLMSQIVSLTTLISVVTVPITAMALTALYL